MRRISGIILAFLLCGVTLPASSEPPAIDLTVTPHVGRAPLEVLAKIMLQKNEHNRSLCIEWDQLLDGGMGCQTVDGAEQAVTVWRHITLRLGGEYNITATVARDDGSLKQTIPITIQVLDKF